MKGSADKQYPLTGKRCREASVPAHVFLGNGCYAYDGQPSAHCARDGSTPRSERAQRFRQSGRAATPGNVVNLADPVTGSTTATYEYSPFGKLLIAHGPAADQNPIRFSTKWQDETGLSYYGYRYYDAGVGRWMSRDPKAERAGGNVSLYRLLNNCTIMMMDYLGLEGYPECDSNGDCYVDDWEWNQCGFKGTTGSVPNCQPPQPQPNPPSPGGGLIASDCQECASMTGAINRVNNALNKGDCRKWFEDHGHDYNSGLPTRMVKCHGNWKLVCCTKKAPAWTFPGMAIGVCKNQCNGYDEVGLASLLIHELAHHYCTWGPGREACAESAQTACMDALSGL